jgi:competence protein ComEA
VASQGKKGAGSAVDWLLEPARNLFDLSEDATGAEDPVPAQKRPGKTPERISTDAAQWLMEPNGGRNGRAAEKPKPAETKPPKPVPEREAPARTNGLSGAERALEAERAVNADLAERISKLEAELRVQSESAEASFARTLEEREAEFAAALRERDEALTERKSEFEARLTKRYEGRKDELSQEFEEKRAELEAQLTALEMRLDVREEELREQASRREAKLENRIRDLQEELADAKLGTNEAASSKRSRRRSGGRNGDLDVNEVTFEQLREVGLSITQSARVIAYRDTRGGFDSLDELDEIPGLPKESRETLKDLLTL